MSATATLTGCASGMASLTCDDLEEEAVRTSGGELIKITQARLVSRTDREIVCEGKGVYSDIEETAIRYRGYLDEDNEPMVEYVSQ